MQLITRILLVSCMYVVTGVAMDTSLNANPADSMASQARLKICLANISFSGTEMHLAASDVAEQLGSCKEGLPLEQQQKVDRLLNLLVEARKAATMPKLMKVHANIKMTIAEINKTI